MIKIVLWFIASIVCLWLYVVIGRLYGERVIKEKWGDLHGFGVVSQRLVTPWGVIGRFPLAGCSFKVYLTKKGVAGWLNTITWTWPLYAFFVTVVPWFCKSVQWLFGGGILRALKLSKDC